MIMIMVKSQHTHTHTRSIIHINLIIHRIVVFGAVELLAHCVPVIKLLLLLFFYFYYLLKRRYHKDSVFSISKTFTIQNI